jgi:SAM-dependent methyltransferase
VHAVQSFCLILRPAAMAADQLRGHYDAMARMHARVTFDDRRAFSTASVRHLNGFVKACMIDAAVRCLAKGGGKIAVADIACGRGQDQSKWAYAARDARVPLPAYFGMDLAPGDAEAAVTMAGKYLSGAAVHVQTGDMGTDAWQMADAAATAVTCQLAMHYIFDAEARVRHFFAEAARVLAPGGVLLLSFADGRSIVRRARDTPDGHYARPYYILDVPPAITALRIPSPFGNRYTFTMPGSVEGVPEYLCHEGMLTRIAAAAGFQTGRSAYFDELAVALDSQPYYAALAAKMGGNWIDDPDALDAANLYRFIVFAREASTLVCFNTCLAHPPLAAAAHRRL